MKIINGKNFSEFLDKNIPTIILQAHCDDESFLSGGLISEVTSKGYKVYLVYFASAIVKDEVKTVIRQNELNKACDILKIKNLFFLDYCEPKYDSNVASPLFLQTENKILKNLEEKIGTLVNDKFNIISYDKNGGYGNSDHIIVHKIGRRILKKAKYMVHVLVIERHFLK